MLEVATASTTQFTALVPGVSNGSDTAGVFTNITTQDYSVATPEFSHIEHASVLDLDATGKPLKWYELTVKNNLSLETSSGRPEFLSPHTEDGQGNTTFRVTAAPDKRYPVSIHIQKAAPAITSINQTWAPIPDFMQYVDDCGFVALMQQFSDDPSRRLTQITSLLPHYLPEQMDSPTKKRTYLNNWEELRMSYGPTTQQGKQQGE